MSNDKFSVWKLNIIKHIIDSNIEFYTIDTENPTGDKVADTKVVLSFNAGSITITTNNVDILK